MLAREDTMLNETIPVNHCADHLKEETMSASHREDTYEELLNGYVVLLAQAEALKKLCQNDKAVLGIIANMANACEYYLSLGRGK